MWAPTPGPPLGRPPPALRARLKTNGQVTAEGSRGSQPGRVAANARLDCALDTLHRVCTCGPPALSVYRLPGLLGWGQPLRKGVLTCGPISPWREDGWVGWGLGTKRAEREGQRLGLLAQLSAKGSGHVAREEARAVTVATVSRAIWEGCAPHLPTGRLRRPGPVLGKY